MSNTNRARGPIDPTGRKAVQRLDRVSPSKNRINGSWGRSRSRKTKMGSDPNYAGIVSAADGLLRKDTISGLSRESPCDENRGASLVVFDTDCWRYCLSPGGTMATNLDLLMPHLSKNKTENIGAGWSYLLPFNEREFIPLRRMGILSLCLNNASTYNS